MNLQIGKVMNNNSATALPTDDAFGQTGAVQIYIESLMHGFLPTQYHWFRPANAGTGGSSSFGTSCIPEIGSYVWCFYEDELLYKKGFYVWNVNLLFTNPHDLYQDNIQPKVGSTSVYPDVKYIYLKNGICIGMSSSLTTPEITIYHPTGSNIFIDTTGSISINGTLVSIKNEVQSMKTLIDGLLDLLTNFATAGTSAAQITDPATKILIAAEKVKWALLLKE